jgi:hypothetical protein
MTAHGFKSPADTVILCFIVPAHHPYLSVVFYPYLGRADDMPCGMEGDAYAVDGYGLAPIHCLVGMIAQAEL